MNTEKTCSGKATLRKIRKDEIPKIARMAAACFRDYPLYDVFFPNDAKREKRLYYFSYGRLYTRQNYTYVTDDGNLLISLQRPGDRDVPMWRLILSHPFLLLRGVCCIPFSVIGTLKALGRAEREVQERHYHPETDQYIKMVCVRKEARKEEFFADFLHMLDNGAPVYCETHSAAHARLYRMLGIRVVEESTFRGVPYYAMRREAVTPPSENA